MWSGLKKQTTDHYHRAQIERLSRYEAAVAAGQYRPFVYPTDSLPALYLLLALLFLPQLPRAYAKALRWPILGLILGHCVHVTRACRSVGLAGGYGIGLSMTWGCIMTFALLFFNDVVTDLKRLEARATPAQSRQSDKQNGFAVSSSVCSVDETELKDRDGTTRVREATSEASGTMIAPVRVAPYHLAWQTYPTKLSHRLEWILDLLTCFRGVNWNFRDPTLSKLDVSIGVKERFDEITIPSDTGSIGKLRIQSLIAFARFYLMLDVLKFLQSRDPYFYGGLSLQAEFSSLIYSSSPFMLKAARLTISAASVYTILNLIFQLCPLFFAAIPLLIPYPSILSITRIPLLSTSMYEPYWGPLVPSVANKGLAGFWGKFWHQIFRFGISQPSAYIIKRFKLDSRSNKARLIQVLTAFFFSGTIHAMASYTSFPVKVGASDPIMGPWSFFMVQGIGVLLQAYTTRAIKSRAFPVWLRRAGNLLFVLVWAWYTGPLLADDFARCGVWMFEPIPISFVRAICGEQWWRWGGRWVGWWTDPGGKWWKSGLALY